VPTALVGRPVLFAGVSRNLSLRALGEVSSQGRNLKALTEGHHQEWSLRLNSTQREEPYRARTGVRTHPVHRTRNSLGGGAWPFLVGGLICLVYSDNGRDPDGVFVGGVVSHVGLRWECEFGLDQNRSVMPLDGAGCTCATVVVSGDGFSYPCNRSPRSFLGPRRANCLVNSEFLVEACHHQASTLSLPFVHTARRFNRLGAVVNLPNRLGRSVNLGA